MERKAPALIMAMHDRANQDQTKGNQMPVNANAGTMVDVKNFFGYTSAASFSGDWKLLSEASKNDLKNAVGKGVSKDGTPPADAPLTY